MTQAVIDTNVIIAAMRSRNGCAHKLVYSLGIDLRWQACISGPLLQEYTEQVFSHAHLAGWSSVECEDFLDYFCASSRWFEVHFLWRPLLSDDDDHMVLEAAVASSAECIVTFNKRDLKPAEQFGIELMTPREFLLSF